MSDRTLALSVDGIRSYLRCPRRYEFAHVDGLEGEADDPTTEGRLEVLRRAICDGLRADSDADALETAILERLGELWADHDERLHSRTQRRHERRVLEATARAYVEAVGATHAAGIDALGSDAPAAEFVGPHLPLTGSVALPEREARASIEAPVDYVSADGSSLVGVRFVPTLRPLGLLRYRDRWEGDVADLFAAHFDPERDEFAPGLVGGLFETSVALEGLRALRDELDLTGYRTCRYVQIPLADRSRVTVNWMRDAVEASLEPCDLTDVFLDHQTFGMTHQHRNGAVESRLADTVSAIARGAFDPASRWETIAEHACPDCAYAVCCGPRVAAEVRFDG
ncbi:PD-(D/E)XK nuclease family protein [Natrononativus amylolyticus]|uniref:PD-(D/E)XK nuclease family protein n=1 Tax=Natrononativus amylolyticus TaxID=2963434 RepID=UPI0020CCEA50|nr:PD-(D/E)XK nuclease family protein [Natrononativus amylolyticus]